MFKIDKSLVDNMNLNKSYIIINHEDHHYQEEIDIENDKDIDQHASPEIKRKEHAILQDARKEAEIIVQEAKKEAEEIKKSALESGYEKGKDDASLELEKLTEIQTQEVNSILKKLGAYKQELDSKMQEQILQLSIDVAEKIINIQLKKDDTVYIGIVKKAIAGLKSVEKFVLRVSRSEYDKYFKEGSKWLQDDINCVSFEVVCDPFVEDRGCIVDSDEGIINAGVETQLEKIQRSLKERANQYG